MLVDVFNLVAISYNSSQCVDYKFMWLVICIVSEQRFRFVARHRVHSTLPCTVPGTHGRRLPLSEFVYQGVRLVMKKNPEAVLVLLEYKARLCFPPIPINRIRRHRSLPYNLRILRPGNTGMTHPC